MEERTFGGILCLFRSDWSLRRLDLCICADASKRASRSRFVKDAASWRRRLVESQSGQGTRKSSRSIHARSRALRSIAPEVGWECSGSDEDEVSLARRESRADFPEASVQLLDPSEGRLAAHGGFLREENIEVLEARSILYAVRFAGNIYPPGRLPLRHVYIAFSHASYLCISFQRRVLSYR